LARVITPSGQQPELAVAITDIIVDCVDVERVAAFWSALLRRPIEGRKGPYVWLGRSDGDVGVGFQGVAEPKRGKNRLHLDVSGPDVVTVKELVEALGGSRAGGYDEGGFLVMTDPEGNEFCVLPTEPVGFDDNGHAHYLDGLDL
jgi:predicted enzyme related to lactoylglutathione lyase